jgi:hypothetical protein
LRLSEACYPWTLCTSPITRIGAPTRGGGGGYYLPVITSKCLLVIVLCLEPGQTRSQIMNTVGAAASGAGAYMYYVYVRS